MGKPRLIILIRHAQSEGNKNREIHQTIPDHRVKLTKDGWEQAYDAGRRLRKLLRPDDTLHFFTSPYRRTRETTEGILTTLTSSEPDPSPFDRANIKVYEEPRLREQDFGNFQPCSAEMERMWQERADYGHFFYRIPNGESAADAYDRVSGFNESLWRQFGEDDFASVCVLVTHGLMSRVFLMKWYHFTVEYFEDLRNVNHCEFLIMRKDDQSGKYMLENKLRTWSELRRERAALKEKEHKESDPKKDEIKLQRSKTYVVTRRWGGCPNGCNHVSHYKKRDDIEALRDHNFDGGVNGSTKGTGNGHVTNGNGVLQHSTTVTSSATIAAATTTSSPLISRRPAANKRFQSYNSDDDPNETHDHDGEDDHDHENGHDHNHQHSHENDGPHIDVSRATEEVVSSPDGTPSFISAEDRLRALKSPYLHVGRDFGGTYSGHATLANSDTELSDDDAARKQRLALMAARVRTGLSSVTNGVQLSRMAAADVQPAKKAEQHRTRDDSGMRRGAQANRLGDAPHSSGTDGGSGSDGDHEGEDEGEAEAAAERDAELARVEKEEKSVAGSVY